MRLRLGTRESDLALARGHYVAEQLRELGHEVELVVLSNTAGAASGMPGAASTKGEFARALRAALYDGSCDVVVHGVKDIPLSQEDATGIARPAVLERSNPFDALCSWDDVPLDKLPRRSRVGTSSLRRIAQLRRVRPDLVIVEVQGTFADRLRRVEPGDLDAVIVSMEGLERLGLEDRASEVLRFIPAPGQGALALECREEDVEIIDALKVLDDHETRISATAEREVLRDLDVDYSAPIGALALRQVVLSLRAVAFSVAGDRKIDLQLGMPTSMLHAKRSGRRVAQALRDRGAHEFCNRAEVDAAGVLEGNEDDAWRAQPPAEAIRLFLPRQEGRLAGGLRDVGFAVDAVALQHAQLIDAENRMADADWVVVPSAHAAWALREKGWYIPPDKRVAAMGETTRSILEQAGVKVQVGPGGTASSDRLVAEFGPGEGQLVVIPCADDLSSKLEEGLRARGYRVERMEIYTMADVAEPAPEIAAAWQDGVYEFVLLSSPSVARSYLRVLGHRPDVKVLAWDPETAAVLNEAGVSVAAVAPSKDEAGVAAMAREVGVGTA